MATTGSARTPGARPAGARRPAKRTGWRRFFNYPRRGKGPIRRWVPSWRVVVGAFLGVFALGAGVAVAAYATTTVPENLESVNDQVTTIYYSDGVTPITTLQNETRILVDLPELPDYVADAVIASEDSSFRTNLGINPRGLARAMWTNLTTSGPTQGASTITQQYVERAMTGTEKSYLGKVREMIIALKVNRTYGKDEVLEGYLNTIFWGRNVNGIGAASQAYFGKPAQELTLSEAAMLAGIIPSPSNWDPDKNQKQAEARWARVLDRMLDQGLITKAERQEATFPEFLPRPAPSNKLGGQIGYLKDMVENEIGGMEQFDNGQLSTRGLNVYTTIDKRLQDQAAAVAATAYQGDNPADPRLRIGLVSIDTATGGLRAVYGGADYVAESLPGGQFNFAMRGGAQGGSTFKPFTLLAALEDGHQLTDRVDGSNRQAFPGTTWTADHPLRNFDGYNPGMIDLVSATANSVNTAYASLNIEIGPQRTVEVAHELGIPDPVKDPANPTEKEKMTAGYIDSNPGNVLGTATVRPVDLATAYATLANGGYRVSPHLVAKVTDLKDNLVYEADTTPERTSFSPENIAAVTYAMTHVITEGSGKTALELNRPVAGKTGTSNDNKSAWFAGFVPQIATVVGLMQEDESGNTADITPFGQWSNGEITGSTFPVRAWTDYMAAALDGVEVKDFPAYTMPRVAPSPTPSPTEEPTQEATPEETPTADPRADWVSVPTDLVGRQVNDAKRALEKLGLRVNTVAVASDEPKSAVVAVALSGQQVPRDSQITLSVSTGNNGNGNGNGNDNGNDGGTEGGDGGTEGGNEDTGEQTPTPTPSPSSDTGQQGTPTPSPDPAAQG